MKDEYLKTYNNYIKKVENLKHPIYDSLLNDVEDLKALKLNIGDFTYNYIFYLKKKLPYFEEVTLNDIEENNYPKVKINAIQRQRQKFENRVLSLTKEDDGISEENRVDFIKANAKFIKKQNNNFEAYFSNLFEILAKEYEENIKDNEKGEKIDITQRLIDDITEALHDAEHNYTLSEIAEKRKQGLIDLRNTFEKRLNDVYFEAIKDEIPRKQAVSLLKNIKKEDKRIDFINNLSKEFKGCKPKEFVTLIACLIDLEYLDENEISMIELHKSFEKALKRKPFANAYFRRELKELLPEIKRIKNLEKSRPDIYDVSEKIKGIEREYQIKD